MNAVNAHGLFSLRRSVLTAALLIPILGCSSGDLKRFAPPGFVKIEELAGDQPANPIVQERVNERLSKAPRNFPRVKDSPSEGPVGLSSEEQSSLLTSLEYSRDALNEEIEREKESAKSEIAQSGDLAMERDALAEAVEKASAVAAMERRSPIDPNPSED